MTDTCHGAPIAGHADSSYYIIVERMATTSLYGTNGNDFPVIFLSTSCSHRETNRSIPGKRKEYVHTFLSGTIAGTPARY